MPENQREAMWCLNQWTIDFLQEQSQSFFSTGRLGSFGISESPGCQAHHPAPQEILTIFSQKLWQFRPKFDGPTKRRWVSARVSLPDAPCMVYLPTFGWFLGQMLVNIPYLEHMGLFSAKNLGSGRCCTDCDYSSHLLTVEIYNVVQTLMLPSPKSP